MQAKQSWNAIAKSNESFRREITSIETILGHSWGHFEESRAVLDPSWSLLGGSWGLPGGSWGLLGRSWGLLGHSWGLLEWSVGAMLPQLIFLWFLVRFWTDLGVQKAPQIDAKWVPKRSKIGGKNYHEKRSLLEPSWIRLGPVLGRFGIDLGVKNHEISLVFKGFRENSHFWPR